MNILQRVVPKIFLLNRMNFSKILFFLDLSNLKSNRKLIVYRINLFASSWDLLTRPNYNFPVELDLKTELN